MDIVVALLIGLGIGWVLGRRSPSEKADDRGGTTSGGHRPSKRQRQILATLEPDPPRKTMDDLIAEELEETGAAAIHGAATVAPSVALMVFRRDSPSVEDVASGRLRYVVDDGIDPAAATADQVRLVADP